MVLAPRPPPCDSSRRLLVEERLLTSPYDDLIRFVQTADLGAPKLSTRTSRQVHPSPLWGLTALWWVVTALLLSWFVYLLVIVFRPHPCCPISLASPIRGVLGGVAIATAIGSGFFLTRKARRV